MPEDPRQVCGPCPERWADRLAIVVLPGHFGLPDVDQIREQLLSVLNRGALVLIADLSATVSCDHAGSDALARVYSPPRGNGPASSPTWLVGEDGHRLSGARGLNGRVLVAATVRGMLVSRVPVHRGSVNYLAARSIIYRPR